jgi:hypothetical protein
MFTQNVLRRMFSAGRSELLYRSTYRYWVLSTCAEPLAPPCSPGQSRTSIRLSCHVDCGPGSYVLGDFGYTQTGCTYKRLDGLYTTREACNSACRANFANLCVLLSENTCYTYNETWPGICDAPVETVSDYERWTVCNGTSAVL